MAGTQGNDTGHLGILLGGGLSAGLMVGNAGKSDSSGAFESPAEFQICSLNDKFPILKADQ